MFWRTFFMCQIIQKCLVPWNSENETGFHCCICLRICPFCVMNSGVYSKTVIYLSSFLLFHLFLSFQLPLWCQIEWEKGWEKFNKLHFNYIRSYMLPSTFLKMTGKSERSLLDIFLRNWEQESSEKQAQGRFFLSSILQVEAIMECLKSKQM